MTTPLEQIRCDYCEKESRYSLGWMGHDGVMHPIHACDDHKYLGFMKQDSESRMHDLSERLRFYRESWKRPVLFNTPTA